MIERGTGLLVIVNAAGARQGEGMEDNALTALSPVTAGFSTLVHVTWRRSFRVSLDAERIQPPFGRCRPFATGLSSTMAPLSLDNEIILSRPGV
jgi:hypothetical protein